MARRVVGHEFLRKSREGGGPKWEEGEMAHRKMGDVKNRRKSGRREKKMLGVGRTGWTWMGKFGEYLK